ncbi:hypothetical protein AcW1_003214 [Taiwanofungus camphoratus]|nr:hypothetical protein AcV5_001597 [Antrodia cinnamomea]KAI0922387.1 hypothetical protein AcV7_005931 [Antrodia cinnamomea]KAI0942640.1 hypothetical protein AcW1_003214 [Antrodia cinnamomea]
MISAQVLILVSFVICLFGARALKQLRRLPLPPGPGSRSKSYEQPWRNYASWSKDLGPLISLRTLGQNIVVINTSDAAIDLLEKRSTFACKPRWPMAELLGRQKNVGFQYYGERLKKSRKFLHGSLNAGAVIGTWSDLLHVQSIKLARSFLNSPQTFYSDVQKNVEELIVCFAYGHEPQPEYVELAKTVMHQTGVALQPGRWMVNFIPALIYVPAWFPGAEFQRWAQSARDLFYQMTRVPFFRVKQEMAQGIAKPSFVREALEDLSSDAALEDEDIVMSAAGSLYSAGTETLTGTILNFLLLIALHPEVQRRAFEEISAVVGNDRLPDLQDRDSLPYIDCLIQEVHRFNPAIPLVTHSNTVEEEYLDYRIPKKTWIMANVWAMLHDEKEYSEPDKFLPERFIHSNSHPAPRDPRTLVYGFGRRLCPGLHFANALLYLIVARTIALFEIKPEMKGGRPRPPPLDFIIGLVPAPKPFNCVLEPRAKAAELLTLTEIQ